MANPAIVKNNRMDIIRILRHPRINNWSSEMKNKMNEGWKDLKPKNNNELLTDIEKKLGTEYEYPYEYEGMPGSPPTVYKNTHRIKLIKDHLGMKGGRKLKKRKTRRKKKKRKTRKAKHRRKKKTRRRKRGGHDSLLQ
jgi:hypothetical protein